MNSYATKPTNDIRTNQTENSHLEQNDINTFLSSNCLQKTTYSSIDDYWKALNDLNVQGTRFSIIGINARSLYTTLSNLDDLPDIIALTETWIQDGMENLYKLNGYKCIGNNKHKRGNDHGGVLIYVRDSIQFTVRNDLEFQCSRYTAQSLFIEISSFQGKKIIIGCVYRPPGGDFDQFDEQLNSVLKQSCKSKQLVYLVGDFNLNLLNLRYCSKY